MTDNDVLAKYVTLRPDESAITPNSEIETASCSFFAKLLDDQPDVHREHENEIHRILRATVIGNPSASLLSW